MKRLTLIRGLPGAGKTSLATRLAGVEVFEADDFFLLEDGTYRYDPNLVSKAHSWCQSQANAHLKDGHSCAVSNTFSKRWEMEPYLRMADAHGARVVVIDLFDGGCTDDELAERTTHDVPKGRIAKMRKGWEHEWRVGETRSPWKRRHKEPRIRSDV